MQYVDHSIKLLDQTLPGDPMAQDFTEPPVEDATPCAERNCRLAAVVLVNERGWLLLQERDEHAPVAPNQWALVGGHVEDGEDWDQAMRRELREETGLVAEGLTIWFDEMVQHYPKVSSHLADHFKVWVGRTDITDADVVVGEGRQIVFIDPARVLDGSIDLSATAQHLLPLFLESATYRAMT